MESSPSSKAPRSGVAPSSPGSCCPSVAAPPPFSGALGLLRSCSIGAPAGLGLDLVSCYAPWVSRGDSESQCQGSQGEVRDVGESGHFAQVPPSVLYPALLGLHSLRREDAFPLGLPLAPLGSLAGSCAAVRRPRSEKKPTPEDQKDQRYLERRRRNNRAAKKSRDARRAREDQIALRAALLEHENAVLRAQLLTLREETHSLRQLLLHAKEHREHRDQRQPRQPQHPLFDLRDKQ